MKNIYFALPLVFSIFLTACKDLPGKPAFLLVGDSWGQLMCAFGSYDKVLEEYGHKNKRAECLLTTQSGSRASQWVVPKKLEIVKKVLNYYPDLKVIVLSLGGNDLLGTWNKNMTPDEEKVMMDKIASDFTGVIHQLKAMRPGLRIVVSGYDYPNFDKLVPGDVLKAYRELFEKMGEPTPAELNAVIVRFTERMALEAAQISDVQYASNLGLHQSIYGQEDYNIKPGELHRPDKDNLVGGDPTLPQSPKALLHINGTKLFDPYHLNPTSYKNLARNVLDIHLKDILQ